MHHSTGASRFVVDAIIYRRVQINTNLHICYRYVLAVDVVVSVGFHVKTRAIINVDGEKSECFIQMCTVKKIYFIIAFTCEVGAMPAKLPEGYVIVVAFFGNTFLGL